MELTELERTILTAAVADLLKLRKAKWATGKHRSAEWGASLRAMEMAKDSVVRPDPARWLGHELNGPAERMAISRAYNKLQSAGLVERMSAYSESRCSYLKLTRKGLKYVKDLQESGRTTTPEKRQSLEVTSR